MLDLAHQPDHPADRQEVQVEKETEGELIVSPILQAPDDILHHIFELCNSGNKLTIDHPYHPTVVLSRVCESWRELILSHSSYWSSIRIETPYAPPLWESYDEIPTEKTFARQERLSQWTAQMQQICHMADTFITRSKEHPLIITLQAAPCGFHAHESNRGQSYMYASLMQLLCSSSGRWRECSFDIDMYDCTSLAAAVETIINLRAEQVSMLTRLKWDVRDAMPLEGSGILRGSSLRSLELHDMQPWSEMSVDWQALTELNYSGFTSDAWSTHGDTKLLHFGPRSALALLKRCRSLVSCTLYIACDHTHSESLYHDYPEEDLGSPIELEHLRSLTIRTYLSTGELVDNLCLPSLRELRLMNAYAASPLNMKSWIRKFGKNLTSLSIVLVDCTPEEMCELLGRVPHLLSLELYFELGRRDSKSLATAVLESLTGHCDDEGLLLKACLCPNLRRFGCFQHFGTFSKLDIVRFIKGRRFPISSRHGASIIEAVKVEFPRPDAVDIRGLLLEEGVDIEGLKLEVIC